uniref:THAP-type domain-containing protein n=1 Tax=Gadus morhua TaxID=8049 RepID=A0A8C5A4K2_GADMO
FTASDYSVVCSQHFKQGDFDRTGQIVRLLDGVIPSLFSFPVHLQRGRLEQRIYFCLGNTLRRHSLASTTTIRTCSHWLCRCFIS